MGGGPDVPDETTTSLEPPEYLKPYLTDAAKRTQALGARPFEIFPNQMFVGPNEFQDLAAGMRLAYGTSPATFDQIGGAMTAQQQMLDAPNVADNTYIQGLKDMNERRTMDRFKRYTRTGIEDQFQGGGSLGSSRHGIAEGLAAGEAERAMQDYNAQVDASAYGEGLTQQRAGMALVPQTLGLGNVPADAYGAFGDYINREREMVLGEQMTRFDFPQNEPWDRLSKEMALYSGMPGSTTTASGGGGGGSNPLGMLGLGLGAYSMFGGGFGAPAMAGGLAGLGGLGAGGFLASGAGAAAPLAGGLSMGSLLSLAPAAASDRRLKENIEELVEIDGVQWYAFDYKDPDQYGHGRKIGVMADEIEDRFPDAVHVMPNGYKAVDYAKVGAAYV